MALLFFIGLLPLIVFVLVDYYTRSLKAGVISAVVMASLMGMLAYWLLGRFDYEAIIVVITMLATGLVSIKLNSPIYFKLQPAITGVIFAAMLAYFQWFDTPLMGKLMPEVLHKLHEGKLISDEMFANMSSDAAVAMIIRFNRNAIFMMLIHAAIVCFAALRLRNLYWLLIKAAGIPFIAVGCLLVELITT